MFPSVPAPIVPSENIRYNERRMGIVEELRALREPKRKAGDDSIRSERYRELLTERHLPRHALWGLVMNMLGRMVERDPTLLAQPEVRAAWALIGKAEFFTEDPPERAAAHDALRRLSKEEHHEGRSAALRAFADAVIMWPEEAALEISSSATQHVAMSADQAAFEREVEASMDPESALETWQAAGGHDAASIAVGREITAQIDALLGLVG